MDLLEVESALVGLQEAVAALDRDALIAPAERELLATFRKMFGQQRRVLLQRLISLKPYLEESAVQEDRKSVV